MCERCERNTQIKRQLADVAYRAPAVDDIAAQALPGFAEYLQLCRQLEAITRGRGDTGGAGALLPGAGEFRAAVHALGPEGRSDVIRIAQFILEMADGIRMNVGTAKMQLQDADTTTITVSVEGTDLVVRVNGKESSRTALAEGQDPQVQLDAAERAMHAHRTLHYPGG